MRKRIFRVFLSLMLTGICLLTAAPDVLAAATVGVESYRQPAYHGPDVSAFASGREFK